MLKWMIEQRRLARHAHCNVKSWNLPVIGAMVLAHEIAPQFGSFPFYPKSGLEVFAEMRRGECRIFGAQIIVR